MSEPRTLSDQPQDPRCGSHYHPEFMCAEPDRSIVVGAFIACVFLAAVFVGLVILAFVSV